jgi:hypothetical protein
MTSSSQGLSACALFVAPRLCSTNSRHNKKSADNICRRQGRSSAREILLHVGRRKFCCVSIVGNCVACLSSEILLRVGRRKFCCVLVVGNFRNKISVVGVLSSALMDANERRPTKATFRRRSRIGVPTPMNADNEVSVGRSGGGRLQYGRFGGEAQDAGVLPVAGGFKRGVPVAGGCSAKRHVVGATSRGAVFIASCC